MNNLPDYLVSVVSRSKSRLEAVRTLSDYMTTDYASTEDLNEAVNDIVTEHYKEKANADQNDYLESVRGCWV